MSDGLACPLPHLTRHVARRHGSRTMTSPPSASSQGGTLVVLPAPGRRLDHQVWEIARLRGDFRKQRIDRKDRHERIEERSLRATRRRSDFGSRYFPSFLFYNSSRMEDPQAAPVVGSPDSAPAEPASPAWGTVSLLRDVAISIVLAIVLIVFIYQPVKVEGTSMMPGLHDQERIFINKYDYQAGLTANHSPGRPGGLCFPKDPSNPT